MALISFFKTYLKNVLACWQESEDQFIVGVKEQQFILHER